MPCSCRWACGLAALTLLTATGCLGNARAQFAPDVEGQAPSERLPPEAQAHVTTILTALFGTPDEPRVPAGAELDLERLKYAAGPVASDQQGRHRGLYREHCATCHGLGGDGAGPVAALLNPHPRDFRRGIFKFTSTHQGAKPTADDLRRTIREGVPGTAMPSFVLLPAEDIDALVEYVRYLALRGESELVLRQLAIDDEPLRSTDTLAVEVVAPLAQSWHEASSRVVAPASPRPSDRAASIAAGAALFNDAVRGCANCHGATGTADRAPPQFDVWNNPKRGLPANELAARFALPLQEIAPRDLTLGSGALRGGSRPEDIYDRIYVGVKGTPMPGYGAPAGSAAADGASADGASADGATAGPQFLSSEQIWNLVDYVLSLQTGTRPVDAEVVAR